MIASIFLYATIGLTIELIFNATRYSFSHKPYDYALKGEASIWMLPIYGLGLTYGFDLIHYVMLNIGDDHILRWLSYPLWIWGLEIVIGLPTKNRLWNYSSIKYNWRGVISLKHYPAWVMFGILIEQLRLYTDPILL